MRSQAAASGRARPARPIHEREAAGAAQRPDRRQVELLVEQQPAFVDVPVEVDGQLRHPGQGLVDVDEDAAVVEHEPARQPRSRSSQELTSTPP